MNPNNWRYCPVWIADRPCAFRILHAGSHLPYVVPRSLPPSDDPELLASIGRHPAGRAK